MKIPKIRSRYLFRYGPSSDLEQTLIGNVVLSPFNLDVHVEDVDEYYQ